MNTSGGCPVEYKVIVKVDKLEETTEGGIIMPPEVLEREQMGHTRGVLIEIGGNSFEDFKPPIPQRGQRVMVARYAGLLFTGADGKEYRVVQDKDIVLILEKE